MSLRPACISTLFLAFLAPFTAHADTLNFNNSPTGTFTTLNLGAYQLTYLYGDRGTIVNVNGTNFLEDSNQNNAYGANVELSRVDGGSFSLNTVDLAMSAGASGLFYVQIANSYFYGAPTTLTTEQISGASNVTGVQFNIVDLDSGYEVTNLNVTSPTPEPSSLILLGSSLLGAVGVVRRRVAR